MNFSDVELFLFHSYTDFMSSIYQYYSCEWPRRSYQSPFKTNKIERIQFCSFWFLLKFIKTNAKKNQSQRKRTSCACKKNQAEHVRLGFFCQKKRFVLQKKKRQEKPSRTKKNQSRRKRTSCALRLMLGSCLLIYYLHSSCEEVVASRML